MIRTILCEDVVKANYLQTELFSNSVQLKVRNKSFNCTRTNHIRTIEIKGAIKFFFPWYIRVWKCQSSHKEIILSIISHINLTEFLKNSICRWYGSHQSWKVLENPGILLKFWKSPGKTLEFFLWSNSPKERFLSKDQHFSGFLYMLNLAVHWLTAVIFIWCIYIGCNVYIFSAHY